MAPHGEGDMFYTSGKEHLECLASIYKLDELETAMLIVYLEMQPEARIVLRDYMEHVIKRIQNA